MYQGIKMNILTPFGEGKQLRQELLRQGNQNLEKD